MRSLGIAAALLAAGCSPRQEPTPRVPEADATQAQSAGQSVAASSASAACAAQEETLFTCAMPGGKRLSVCGRGGNAQYRFGGASAELTVDSGRFNNAPYSGGGESQIAFASGNTRYIVFSRTVRTNFTAGEPNNPQFTDGVMVVRPGKAVVSRECAGEADTPVDLSAADRYGGTGSDVVYPAD